MKVLTNIKLIKLIFISATAFLEFWKRKQAEIQYDWDMVNFELEEHVRPEFEYKCSKKRINPVTMVSYSQKCGMSFRIINKIWSYPVTHYCVVEDLNLCKTSPCIQYQDCFSSKFSNNFEAFALELNLEEMLP